MHTQQQFKARVARVLALTARTLDPQQSKHQQSAQVVDKLVNISKRCSLIHNLLQMGMKRGEFEALVAREIDFLRCSELFLDQLGIRHLRDAEAKERGGLI